MDNPNPIKYSDLIQPDNSITDLISQLDELIATYEDARSKIQSAASDAAKSMQALSGATEEQRKQIELTADASEKLLSDYQDSEKVLKGLNEKYQDGNQALKEFAKIQKLVDTINREQEGSYNKLSAQYRLNKIRLNEMSEAMRYGTEAGRKLEAETKAIYERMNEMQKATGKAQLQVGQYERALGGLVGLNPKLVSALTDSKQATQALGGIFSALKGPIGIAIGAIGGVVAAFKLFKDSIHETQSTGDAFDIEMAGWTATWDVFKKSISAVDFSGFIMSAHEAALAGRTLKQVLDETFERTTSTRLLRASMSAENAALQETMRNAKLSAEERIAAANKYLENMEPIYEQETETARRNADAQLEYLFALTNRRQFASKEERERAKQEFADNIKNYNLNEDLIKQAQQYNWAVERRATLYDNVQAASGKVYEALDREAAALDNFINSASAEVKSFSQFVKQYGLTNDEQVKAYADARVAYEESLAASYNDQKRIITMRDSLEAQQTQKAQAEAAKRVAAAEKEAKDRQKAEEDAAKESARLAAQEIANARAVLNAKLQSIQLQIAATEDGTDEMFDLRRQMIEQQRQIELFENRQKTEELRQDEAAINKKYDTLYLREEAKFNTQRAQRDLAALQDLAAAEFELLDRNERQKTLFRLQQEEHRLREVLRINEGAAEKMTETEIEAARKAIEGIQKERARLGYNNLGEVLGLNLTSQQQGALDTAINSTVDSLGSLIDAWEQVAQAAVKAAGAQVSAAQQALDAEIEARNNGYANEVETARKELELARKRQAEAEAQARKAQKIQLALDSVTQSSSLITATANIWAAFSKAGMAGPALAAAATALMWGSFAAAKIKAFQMAGVEQYGEGTVELLQGGSHASGHDIDLGRKRDGTRRRAEGGEFFAVINKRNSRRYRNVIPEVINAFNDGTFAERYQRANAAMSGVAINIAGGGADVSGLAKDVAAIRAQGDEARFVDAQGNEVIRYKNLTRKIKS